MHFWILFGQIETENDAENVHEESHPGGRVRNTSGEGLPSPAMVAVNQANDVPIIRPPMLAAKLSPVPRK